MQLQAHGKAFVENKAAARLESQYSYITSLDVYLR